MLSAASCSHKLGSVGFAACLLDTANHFIHWNKIVIICFLVFQHQLKPFLKFEQVIFE